MKSYKLIILYLGSLLAWGLITFLLIYNGLEMLFLTDKMARYVGAISIFLIVSQLIWIFTRFIRAIIAKDALAITGNLITVIALSLLGIGMFWATMLYFGLGTYTDG